MEFAVIFGNQYSESKKVIMDCLAFLAIAGRQPCRCEERKAAWLCQCTAIRPNWSCGTRVVLGGKRAMRGEELVEVQ